MLEQRCPIWHTPAKVAQFCGRKDSYQIDSQRVNGRYDVFGSTSLDSLYNLEDSEKARLTTWLIEQHSDGVSIPKFGTWFKDLIKENVQMSVDQRLRHLLKYMKRCSPDIGDHFEYLINPPPALDCPRWIRYVEMLAFSQSWKSTQIEYLTDTLTKKDC